MNQILQTESKKSGPIQISKVALFFAIAIIIFGLILVGQGSYAMIIGTKDKEKEPPMKPTNPEVNIVRVEENILINITHTMPIKSVIYSWNDETEQTIETNNQTSISKEIELPFGNNKLNLTVIDQNENQFKYTKEYAVDGDGKPVIELLLTKENKIRIKAQDSQGLKFIRYTWNNGNYVTVEANIEDLKLIDQLADIPLGQNTLRVEAVNINDMITTKELEVKGIRRPIVSLRQDGDKLIIRAEDEVAMKVINFTLNGQKYQINYGEVKVIERAMPLKQGENIIELVAENVEGGMTQVKGKCIVK